MDGEIQRQANNLTANHAGFIKRILGLNVDFDARKLRPNLLINLAKMGADLPWQDFSFKTNAPLKYTKSGFAARIAEVKKLAKEIIQAAYAL